MDFQKCLMKSSLNMVSFFYVEFCRKIITRNFCAHDFALQVPREMRCEFVCAKVPGDNLAEYGVIFCMLEIVPEIRLRNFGAHVFA
jgi:hypothetical protein